MKRVIIYLDRYQPFIIAFLLALAATALLTGCTTQTREQTDTEKWDKVTLTGSLTVPTAEGPRPVPLSITVDRTGGEKQAKESDSRTGIDGAAIGREIAAVLAPLIQTAGGPSLMSILNAAGLGLTAATTGYLAVKKREQLRAEKKGT